MTTGILIITGLISLLAFNNHGLFRKLEFHPFSILHSREYHRFLSYGLVHADWIHLGVNLFVFYSFGNAVESYFRFFIDKPGFHYLLLYTGGIIFSVLPSFGKHKSDPSYSAVGASGAVSAVVFSSIIFNPSAGIGFLFLPFSLPAAVFGLLYLVYSAYMARRGTDNIGHDAHFWGAVYGIVFTIAVKPALFSGFLEKINSLLTGN